MYKYIIIEWDPKKITTRDVIHIEDWFLSFVSFDQGSLLPNYRIHIWLYHVRHYCISIDKRSWISIDKFLVGAKWKRHTMDMLVSFWLP